MASVGEEDVDYDSDPEEAKRSLAMRRRAAASDDEEGEEEVREKPRVDPRAVVHSDESDDQGGAAEYDDDEELEEEEEEIDEEEEVEEEVVGEEDLEGYRDSGREGKTGGRVEVLAVTEMEGDGQRSVEGSVDGNGGNQVEEGEEKKENEPFAVPTAGAFYMHDDRFRDNSVGRHSRRTHGGRKLWESKDERKWGHDKFEEITLQERHYEEGKKPLKGPYVGRGRNRGIDRGSTRGNRSKEYDNNNLQVPKGVRGRGPRRYEPAFRNNRQAQPTQNKQSGKPAEKNVQSNSERTFTPNSNAQSDQVFARKNVFASSLNSASPPFYPSGSSSSNKDITLSQKRDVQAGSGKRNVRSSVMRESFSVPQTNALVRGKNIAESVDMDKLYINDSTNPATGKTLTNIQMSPSGSFVNTTQAPQSRVQGRGVIHGQMSYQPVSQNQMTRASPSTHLHAVRRNPAQNRSQLALQAPAQQMGERPGSESQASSPPKTTMSSNSFESGEVESPSDSSKSKGALVAKGKGSVQGSGRGTLTYGGAPVMGPTGSMDVNHKDINFPGTPAFLPVMQFGGQHTGGMGVPAVGMAFPGYVAQPQLGGLGNSGEMTWLPVLAGAAGALGATYCPSYITVDGSYHARPLGQTSSVGSLSKENNPNKTSNEWKPSQKPEIVGDEYGQRQNKPRRYSQMNVASEVLQNNMELSFVQPFVIFSLCSGALWANVFQDILVMYDKHLLMLYSTYDQHLRLDGWHCLFTCSVFLWFGFFIEKLVRNEDGPPRKLLYKENGKKKVQITVVQQQQFRRSDFQKVFFFFFNRYSCIGFFVYLYC